MNGPRGTARPQAAAPVVQSFSQLILGILNFGLVTMIAYVIAGPDETKQRVGGPSAA